MIHILLLSFSISVLLVGKTSKDQDLFYYHPTRSSPPIYITMDDLAILYLPIAAETEGLVLFCSHQNVGLK